MSKEDIIKQLKEDCFDQNIDITKSDLSITLLILPANESRKIDRPVMLHVT
jgi:hypothetical protein